MVTRKNTSTKKSRVKVGKLKLNRETVKDLSASEKKQIKGGGSKKEICLETFTIQSPCTR